MVIVVVGQFVKGFKQFIVLSLLNIYNDVMGLELGEVEYLLAIVSLPWSFKIVYGFMSDNLKVFETKRKGHLILNITCCILAISLILIFHTH